jgi:heterodisulfide reductase subunit A-like polyferredoxin
LKETNSMNDLLQGIGCVKDEIAAHVAKDGRRQCSTRAKGVDAVKDVQVDTLVLGGGIAGMQAALDLADQGYQVALVEKEASIGGKMIALSKVFPTLDCCSCITTPKMSAVAHHENIQLLTYCEVQALDENGTGFQAGGEEAALRERRQMHGLPSVRRPAPSPCRIPSI